MSTDPRVTPTAQQALAQAAEWRLLGLLFEHPDPANDVDKLCPEIADSLLCEAAQSMQRVSTANYTTTIGPGGYASPREVGYRGRQDPGVIVGDIAAFYEAFAFRPDCNEPPDHVAVECGFVGYLWLKEAYALAQDDSSAAAMCARARQRFVDEHLRYMAEPLAQRLAATEHPVLRPAAQSLVSRTGPAPAPAIEPECDDHDIKCDTCPGV